VSEVTRAEKAAAAVAAQLRAATTNGKWGNVRTASPLSVVRLKLTMSLPVSELLPSTCMRSVGAGPVPVRVVFVKKDAAEFEP
jgi:hypothetical protein